MLYLSLEPTAIDHTATERCEQGDLSVLCHLTWSLLLKSSNSGESLLKIYQTRLLPQQLIERSEECSCGWEYLQLRGWVLERFTLRCLTDALWRRSNSVGWLLLTVGATVKRTRASTDACTRATFLHAR